MANFLGASDLDGARHVRSRARSALGGDTLADRPAGDAERPTTGCGCCHSRARPFPCGTAGHPEPSPVPRCRAHRPSGRPQPAAPSRGTLTARAAEELLSLGAGAEPGLRCPGEPEACSGAAVPRSADSPAPSRALGSPRRRKRCTRGCTGSGPAAEERGIAGTPQSPPAPPRCPGSPASGGVRRQSSFGTHVADAPQGGPTGPLRRSAAAGRTASGCCRSRSRRSRRSRTRRRCVTARQTLQGRPPPSPAGGRSADASSRSPPNPHPRGAPVLMPRARPPDATMKPHARALSPGHCSCFTCLGRLPRHPTPGTCTARRCWPPPDRGAGCVNCS